MGSKQELICNPGNLKRGDTLELILYFSIWGTGDVDIDGDTIFRIASISKAFTVYAFFILQSPEKPTGLKLDDVVTKWIPELMDGENSLNLAVWDQISLRVKIISKPTQRHLPRQ